MKTKLLGRTGISVSELCFGTMSFGGDADEVTSAAMYKMVREAGINFFDTANEYNKGRSEEILGRLMKSHRDDLVIARDGRLLDVKVTRSSGYPEFDNGVLQGVRSGSPYAPLPPEIKGDSAAFDLPLVSVNRGG